MYLFEDVLTSTSPRERAKPVQRSYSSRKQDALMRSWVDQAELEYAELRTAEVRWKQEKMLQEKKEALREKELRSLDHGYSSSNPPSLRIRSLISELKGDSKGDYERRVWALHRKDVPSDLKTDVARAMLLSQSSSGLLDEIAANLTESVLKDFTDWDSVLFSISNRGGYFTWDQLTNDPLSDYFRPGRELYSEDGEPVVRDSSILELKLKKGSVKLLLQVASDGSGLSWKPRGTSALKAAHKKLAVDLNEVLADYDRRLNWVQEYREAPLYHGYTSNDRKHVGESIKHFYNQEAPRLEFLSAGVYMGDQFTVMEGGRTRIYPVRCMSCGRTVDLECVSDLRGDKKWSGSGTTDGIHISDIIPKPARSLLAALHRASGCDEIDAISVRTGRPFNI